MFRFPSVSVIITSYNQAKTLKLLLASLERQTFLEFEVVIADDGSSDETSKICAEARKFSIHFVTQNDQGYRKSKILNEALRRAKADYLIFLDGDVVLEPHFIEDHLTLREEGHFVCGRRVDLGPKICSEIAVSDIQQGKFDHVNLILLLSSFIRDTKNIKRAFRITRPQVRRFLGYNRTLDLLGSNFSAWASDIKGVNGFNEAMESYWGEDGDLFIRLRNSGTKPIGAKGLCIQYHLFHKRRIPTPENEKSYQTLLKDSDYKWAVYGYQKK